LKSNFPVLACIGALLIIIATRIRDGLSWTFTLIGIAMILILIVAWRKKL